MVHKKPTPRPRGRPRSFDEARVLDAATAAFWDAGYSATSLDDLGTATGLNRPSLYNAFGHKRELYLTTMERYRDMGRRTMREALSGEAPFAEALRRVYRAAIAIYLDRGRGCFLIGTATSEAVRDSVIRERLAAGLHELDDLMEARIRDAVARGELVSALAPGELALVACSIMNALALRARAGDGRAALEAIAEAGVRLIAGPDAAERAR